SICKLEAGDYQVENKQRKLKKYERFYITYSLNPFDTFQLAVHHRLITDLKS
ncbi:16425_t:CDS:1, partial [Gigaspora rosea]